MSIVAQLSTRRSIQLVQTINVCGKFKLDVCTSRNITIPKHLS